MDKNSKAWHVSYPRNIGHSAARDVLKMAVQYGILAPSAHNTQPWYFEIEHDVLKIFLDNKKSLSVSDPTGRQSYLSIGCCITNIKLALDSFGWNYELVMNENILSNIAATIKLKNKNNSKVDDGPLSLIKQRKTNRTPYSKKKINESVLYDVSLGGSQIKLITKEEELLDIKKIMIEAFDAALQDKKFREELSQWIKPNITKSFEGMPGYTLNIPTPPSLLVPWMLKHLDIRKILVKENYKALKETPVIAVLTIVNDTKKEWLKAGMLAQMSFLEATRWGLSSQVFNAPVEVEKYSLKIRKVIGGKPAMVWRLGYAKKEVSHSPRKPLKFVLQ